MNSKFYTQEIIFLGKFLASAIIKTENVSISVPIGFTTPLVIH